MLGQIILPLGTAAYVLTSLVFLFRFLGLLAFAWRSPETDPKWQALGLAIVELLVLIIAISGTVYLLSADT